MAEATTLLQGLKITEVSGVDDPANMLPGFMVTKSRDGIQKAQQEFGALLEEIRTKAGLTDDERVEKVRAAVAACPQAISVPAMKQATLADRIREQFDIGKAHDLRHPETGKFTTQREHALARLPGAPAEATTVVPWSHSGVVHEALRGAPDIS
jgi:hypothetical protein